MNNEINIEQDIQLNTKTGTFVDRKAILLNENKVFIVYNMMNGIYYDIYGMICLIDGTTITTGINTQLTNVNNSSSSKISIAALTEDKVFITNSSGKSPFNLYGMICMIEGTTITAGENIELNATNRGSNKTVKLSENKVAIIYSDTTYFYIYGMICTIDGIDITAGVDTQLSTVGASSTSDISVVVLNENKIFIAHGRYLSSSSTSTYLYGIVCIIDETAITKGTYIQLSTMESSGIVISTVKLSENKVFIAHSRNGNYYINGMICMIDGTTITKGNDYQFSVDTGDGSIISAVKLNDKRVFIAYKSNDTKNNTLCSLICSITGTIISTDNYMIMNSNANSGASILAMLIAKDKIFIIHSGDTSYKFNGIICTFHMIASRIENIEDKILGIANTSGTEGETIEVYVPEEVSI